MKTLKVVCKYCNKIVYRSPSSNGKYCSKECYWNDIKGITRTPNKYCITCGVEIKGHQKHKQGTKYCSSRCYGIHKAKPFIIKKGYKKILIPNHNRSDTKGYVFEHIIIMQHKIGRNLTHCEVVHHKDKNKLNNSPDNLVLCDNQSKHIREYHTNP